LFDARKFKFPPFTLLVIAFSVATIVFALVSTLFENQKQIYLALSVLTVLCIAGFFLTIVAGALAFFWKVFVFLTSSDEEKRKNPWTEDVLFQWTQVKKLGFLVALFVVIIVTQTLLSSLGVQGISFEIITGIAAIACFAFFTRKFALASAAGNQVPYYYVTEWVKGKYGKHFSREMSAMQANSAIEKIINEERKKGAREKQLKGLSKFLKKVDYEKLVVVE
jgi:hypothetical protein